MDHVSALNLHMVYERHMVYEQVKYVGIGCECAMTCSVLWTWHVFIWYDINVCACSMCIWFVCVCSEWYICMYTVCEAYMWFPVYTCDIVYAMQCLCFCEYISTYSMCLSCLDVYIVFYVCQSRVWYVHVACVLLQYIVSMWILPVYVLCVVCAGMCRVFFCGTPMHVCCVFRACM